MTASRTEVLLWAERIVAKKNGPPHDVLEVPEGSGPDEAQAAFHAIARSAHPDLHRNVLSPEELELVTSAYAAVAGAYMQLRSQTAQTTRMKPLEKPGATPPASAPQRPTPPPTRTPPAGSPTARPSGPLQGPDASTLSVANAAQQMSPKAIVYFRKAEAALKRGDFKGALLQIKLAIAADPQSTFLRNALAEVDAELRRST